MKKRYYSMAQEGSVATVNIYGDITSWPWFENDVSSYNLSQQLEAMQDVSEIHVFINSYGGEVGEGVAIYNALKRHKAKVKTVCDGFACSIASVIFMAGDERIMNDSSALMIHNAWTSVSGNAKELRKQADDLEKITQLSVTAYANHSTLSKEEIEALMDKESWILPEEALEYGFATAIEKSAPTKASQNARHILMKLIEAARQAESEDESGEDEDDSKDDADDENRSESDESDESSDEDSEDAPPEPEDDPEEEPEDESEDEEEEKPTERWCGFFNALIN